MQGAAPLRMSASGPGFMSGIHVLTPVATSKSWMAGTSPAMTLRGCAPHLSCPRLSRASTSLQLCNAKDVDGRNESGHDVERLCLCLARLYAGNDVFVALKRQSLMVLAAITSSARRGVQSRIRCARRGHAPSRSLDHPRTDRDCPNRDPSPSQVPHPRQQPERSPQQRPDPNPILRRASHHPSRLRASHRPIVLRRRQAQRRQGRRPAQVLQKLS